MKVLKRLAWEPARRLLTAVLSAALALLTLGIVGELPPTTAALNRLELEPIVAAPTGFDSFFVAKWLNGAGLPDPGVPSNYGLFLARLVPVQAFPETNAAFAGAFVKNLAGLPSITELGFDIRLDSPCTFDPVIRVATSNGRIRNFPCNTGTRTPAPGGQGFWDRVRFRVPPFPPGVTVSGILIAFGQFENMPSAARLDNFDVNGTFIPRYLPHVLFASNRDGNYEVYVMYDDGANQTRLTNNPATDLGGVFSRDRKRIAFASDRDGPGVRGEIYAMNADGTNVTRLTFDPAYGSVENHVDDWNLDGTRILFHSNRADGCCVFNLWIMNADGTNPQQLTFGSNNDTDAEFSPDGRRIVFISWRSGNADIWVMNADGTSPTQLTTNPGYDASPCFSPDGSKIAFWSTRDGNFEIYTMNANGSGQTNITNNPATDTNPCFNPDGRIIFNSDRTGDMEVYIMNVDGSNVTRLTFNHGHDFCCGAFYGKAR